MRIKTDARRQAIIAIAIDVFREQGFERASMAMIAGRLGGSKTTLYNYFKSKEELFVAAMTEALDEQAKPVVEALERSDLEPQAALTTFGCAYVRLISQPDTLAVTRTAVSEGAKEGLGAVLYERGPQRALDAIADRLRRLADEGKLPPLNPPVAALHLKALLDAGFNEPLLYGAKPPFDIEEAIEQAVHVFLAAYGPDQLR